MDSYISRKRRDTTEGPIAAVQMDKKSILQKVMIFHKARCCVWWQCSLRSAVTMTVALSMTFHLQLCFCLFVLRFNIAFNKLSVKSYQPVFIWASRRCSGEVDKPIALYKGIGPQLLKSVRRVSKIWSRLLSFWWDVKHKFSHLYLPRCEKICLQGFT